MTRLTPAEWRQHAAAERAEAEYTQAAVDACRELGLTAEALRGGVLRELVEALGKIRAHECQDVPCMTCYGFAAVAANKIPRTV